MSTEFVILGITLISSLGFLGVSFLLHHTKSKWFLLFFLVPIILLLSCLALILQEIIIIQCNGITPSWSLKLETNDLKKIYEIATTEEPARVKELCEMKRK